MHGLKQLVYDNQPFFSSNQTGKTNRELYILWKQNKRDDIFLLLYTQLWMVLEEVYMENVIDYYKKDCYEKKLFFTQSALPAACRRSFGDLYRTSS